MLLLHAVSVFYCLLCVIASVWGQIIKTSLKDTESVLLCESSNSVLGETYQWSELVPPSDAIPIYVVGNGILTNSTNQKYSNFKTDVSSYPMSVPLTIKDVVPEDEGTYQCNAAFAKYFMVYEVVVEVPGTVSITYESQDVKLLTVTVGESYDITCTATGTRSRNELSFMWEPPLAGGTLVKQPNGDFINYTITSTYTPKKEDRSIICQLTGYVLQDEIKHFVSDSISLDIQYKPECSLMVDTVDGDCRMVTLRCECTAVPEVQQYLFYNGSDLMNNTVINNITVNVDYDTASVFSCQASNEVGTGEKSNEEHSCKEGTTALPTTTVTTEITSTTPVPTATGTSTMTTMFTTTAPPETSSTDDGIDGKGGEPRLGLIIGLICVGLIVICAGGGVAFYCIKRGGINKVCAN